MTAEPFSAKDRALWNGLFADVPAAWRAAPPSRALVECSAFLAASGVRTVLDVGCGIGRWSMHFARAGFSVSASDFAENGVRYAADWARDEGVRVRLRCCPVNRVPFPGERFDAVVAALVLDNVTRREMVEAVACVRASLRTGGVVFALFNPALRCVGDVDGTPNPTTGVTQVAYADEELPLLFGGFRMVRLERFEMGTRGVFLMDTAGSVRAAPWRTR